MRNNAKRVRFVGHEMPSDPASDKSRGAVPKTSEYAYFRKFRSSFGHGHADSGRKPWKDSNFRHVSEELREEQGPKRSCSPSPLVSKRHKSLKIKVHHDAEPIKKIKKKPVLVSDDFTPVQQSRSSSPLFETFKGSESPETEKGIFSEKRKKLRHLTYASFSEVEDLQLKGIDLVSSLVSRLFPKECENDNSLKDDMSKSLVLHEADIMEKSKRREWDGNLYKAPSIWPNETFPLYWGQYLEPALGISYFWPPYEKHHSAQTTNHLEGPKEFCIMIDQNREKSSKLMLGWDHEWGEDVTDSSDNYVYHQMISDTKHDLSEFLALESYPELESFPNDGSVGRFSNIFGPTSNAMGTLCYLATAENLLSGTDKIAISPSSPDWFKERIRDVKHQNGFGWKWNYLWDSDHGYAEIHPLTLSGTTRADGEASTNLSYDGEFFSHNFCSNSEFPLDRHRQIHCPLLLNHDAPSHGLHFLDDDHAPIL